MPKTYSDIITPDELYIDIRCNSEEQNSKFLLIKRGIAMEYTTITCVQCDTDFEFSEQDQERYERMGFDQPRRCPLCRKHKSGDSNYHEKRRHKNKKKHFRIKYDLGENEG